MHNIFVFHLKSFIIAPPKEKLSFSVPAYLVFTVKTLEKISLSLATKFALYLFFRPIPFKRPAREKPIVEKAKKTIGHVQKKPFTLYEWGEGEKQVLVLHGWSGRATQFYMLVEALVQQGYKVIGVDAPAHGEHQEKNSNMLEFVEAVKVAHERFGDFHMLVGHSLGGMALFNAIDRYKLSQRIVILGTPASVPYVVKDFCDKIGGGAKMVDGICQKIEHDFNTDIVKISTDYLASKNNPYGWVFHDENDLDVGIENGELIAENWPNGRFHKTENLGHRRILSDAVVIDKIVGFANEHVEEIKKDGKEI
jgi:pimeloyl-ACP methyl ester carboxylesterase